MGSQRCLPAGAQAPLTGPVGHDALQSSHPGRGASLCSELKSDAQRPPGRRERSEHPPTPREQRPSLQGVAVGDLCLRSQFSYAQLIIMKLLPKFTAFGARLRGSGPDRGPRAFCTARPLPALQREIP